ncbi:hypothetical protein [Nocardia australiensis]|uniref:hypothetical protein n=1 Tax=Nocardia australiensis TaxID=2887191 RepID=UPI001D13B753|nr:hypothetical protein [Nocardia australiensis]
MSSPTRYGAIAYTAAVAERQQAAGSISWYARHAAEGDDIGPTEELDMRAAALIRETDSFFIATVTPSGWPYVQGVPPGYERKGQCP